MRHCNMFHILHGEKIWFVSNIVCIALAQNCSLPQPFQKKKNFHKKKGGDIPEKHPLPSRAALSVISFFLHQLIVQFTCMA